MNVKSERNAAIFTITHIIPVAPHAFDRRPPHGVRVKPLNCRQLQVELVFAPGHVDVSQVHSATSILPGIQHVGAYRPGTVYRVVPLHWGTFRGCRSHNRPRVHTVWVRPYYRPAVFIFTYNNVKVTLICCTRFKYLLSWRNDTFFKMYLWACKIIHT